MDLFDFLESSSWKNFWQLKFSCLASFYCNNENLKFLPFSWESFLVNIFSLKNPFECLKEQGKGKEILIMLKRVSLFCILKTFPFIFLIQKKNEAFPIQIGNLQKILLYFSYKYVKLFIHQLLILCSFFFFTEAVCKHYS